MSLFLLSLGLSTLGFLFFFPLAHLFSFAGEVSRLFSNPIFIHILKFTYFQAFMSALLSTLFGLLFGVWLSDNHFRGKGFIEKCLLIPMGLPSLLVVLSILGFWGRNGILNRWLQEVGWQFDFFYGWGAILLSHVFCNAPYAIKTIAVFMREMDRTLEQTALSLGSSRFNVFFRVTLRLIREPIFSSFIISFLFCSSSFLIVLMLGGSPEFSTIEVAIYQAIKVNFDLKIAGGLSLVQILFSSILFIVLLRRHERGSFKRFSHTQIYSLRDPRLNFLPFFFLIVLWGGPFFALFLKGIKGVWLIKWDDALLGALFYSLNLSIAAGLLSVFLGVLMAYQSKHRRQLASFLSFISECPMAVSTLTLSTALMLTYPFIRFEFKSTFWFIVLVQSLIALPMVYRLISDRLFSISNELYQSAQSLGANDRELFWRVELPLLKSFLLTGFLYGFSFSLGEIGAVLLFVSNGVSTIPLQMYRLMSQYRFEEAHGMGLLLLLTLLIVYGVIDVIGVERRQNSVRSV